MAIEIILKKDVDGLGDEGEIKKVANGYARNYLLPFGHAVLKTDNNLKKLESEKDAIQKRKQEKFEASKSFADKINGIELNFEENAADNGKLFGSISIVDILQKLKDQGFNNIEKKQIHLTEHIKNIGTYDIPIKVYSDLNAKIKVNVKLKEEEPKEEVQQEG